MEVEKLSDFLEKCCRVCLDSHSEMYSTSYYVQNCNKTIDQLFNECLNLKLPENYPRYICDECTTELVMVAEFRKKCEKSMATLNKLMTQINKTSTVFIKISKTPDQDATNQANVVEKATNGIPQSDKVHEAIEYQKPEDESQEYSADAADSENNYEYVIFDSNSDIIEETEIINTTQEDDEELQIQSSASKQKFEVSSLNQRDRRKKQSPDENAFQQKLMAKSVIKYYCKHCGAGFAHLNNLSKHLLTHKDTTSQMDHYTCFICDAIFADDQDLIEHKKIHQRPSPIKEVPSPSSDIPLTAVNETKTKKKMKRKHYCQYCSWAFCSQSLLAAHVRIHTGERPFPCTVCTKSFKTQGALDLHLRRHTGEKPFLCSVCNRGFVESSNLKVHMRSHTGEKPHECVLCHRRFTRVWLLQIHQRTHTGERPYACNFPLCKKSFAQQGDLAAHKRIHSGERPHRCQICNKGFIKSSGLTQHLRRHNKTESRPVHSKTSKLDYVEENVKIDVDNEGNKTYTEFLDDFREEIVGE